MSSILVYVVALCTSLFSLSEGCGWRQSVGWTPDVQNFVLSVDGGDLRWNGMFWKVVAAREGAMACVARHGEEILQHADFGICDIQGRLALASLVVVYGDVEV